MTPDGKLVVSRISDVLESMANGSGAHATVDASGSASEPIESVESKVIGQIATVWMRYQFIVNGKVHHHGHQIISLVKQGDHWLIAGIVDEATSTPE